VFELAGGHAVLCGPGLYVNRALAVALAGPMVVADFELLERRSAVVGVPPSIDVTPTTDGSVIGIAAARGYSLQRFLTTHVRRLGGIEEDASLARDPTVVVERADGELLGVWQDVAAAGFAVGPGEPRRANDGVATLGGMATVPAHRRRGVQRALVAHRLRLAAERGCDLAVASTAPANDSERNLYRAGFRPLHETVTLAREPRGSGSS
jgi:GNAT superfamily N-acetyltransferase